MGVLILFQNTTLYNHTCMHAILHTELCWCSLRPELRLIGTSDFRLCVTVGKRVRNQLAHLYIAMQSDPY